MGQGRLWSMDKPIMAICPPRDSKTTKLDVVNYIRNSWGNQNRQMIVASDVAQTSKPNP